MTRGVVQVPGRRYTVSPDQAIPDGDRARTLVEARLVDELTLPPRQAVVTATRVTPTGRAFARPAARAAVWGRVADGGLAGIAGVPREVMPGVTVASYELGMTVAAEGYLPMTAVGTVALPPGYPATFAPLPLGDLELHRRGISIVGRVVQRMPNGALQAASGAQVSVTAVWRALPTLTTAVAAQAPNVLSLGVPCYAARTTAARVRSCVLAPAAVPAKTLLRPAAAGSTTLYLSDRDGLVTNAILGVARGSARAEHVVIAAVDPSVPPTAPGRVTLAHPLALAHDADTVAERVTRQGPLGPFVGFALASIPGDDVLVLSSMAGLGVAGAVEVSGGGAVREYHDGSPPWTTADSEGFYRLPPIAREAQLRLRVTFGALPALGTTVSLEYPAREQRVDFVFP